MKKYIFLKFLFVASAFSFNNAFSMNIFEAVKKGDLKNVEKLVKEIHHCESKFKKFENIIKERRRSLEIQDEHERQQYQNLVYKRNRIAAHLLYTKNEYCSIAKEIAEEKQVSCDNICKYQFCYDDDVESLEIDAEDE